MRDTSTIELWKWPVLGFLLLLTLPGWSQKVYPEWVKSWGGPTASSQTMESPAALVTDNAGNIYTTGAFSMTVDMDPDPGSTLNFTAQGLSDIFIQKLNPEGKLVWAKQLGSSGNQWTETGYDLALDKNGALLITGAFCGTVDFDPGAGVFSLTATGFSNSFILKLDTSGNFTWVKTIEGSDNTSNGVTTDDQGNVYATGTFRGTTDFDPGTGISTLAPATSTDIFLLKLNSNGDFVWAVQNFAIGSGNVGRKLVVDDKHNIYVGSAKRMVTSNSTAAHIWKLDNVGNTIWEYIADGPRNTTDLLRDIDMSTDGFIYATGLFADTVDFNAGGTPNIQVSKSGRDGFVLKMNTAGQVLWVRTVENFSCDAVKVDSRGNVAVIGQFTGSLDFDPGPGVFNLSSQSLDRSDACVWKLDREGQFMDAYCFGSTSYDGARGIDIDRFGTVYVAGTFALPGFADTGVARIDFDPGSGILDAPVYGGGDAFIVKFICKDTSSSTVHQNFCGSFIFNGETYTEPGTYTQHLPNAVGCDSIIRLELSLLMEEAPLIRINVLELSTLQLYNTYQWLLDDQIITGATARNYTVTQNGSYTVEVTDENDCPGTSDPYVVSNVGIANEAIEKANMRVYPNPAINTVYIQKPKGHLVSLWSIDGRQLLSPTTQNTISIATMAIGTYWLKITDDKGNRIKTEQIAKITR